MGEMAEPEVVAEAEDDKLAIRLNGCVASVASGDVALQFSDDRELVCVYRPSYFCRVKFQSPGGRVFTLVFRPTMGWGWE